jgi:hypothetical protein
VKINLQIQRAKTNDSIVEVFSVSPKKYSVLHDSSRAIHIALWSMRNLNSLHTRYKLKDIKYSGVDVIYVYEYDPAINANNIPLSETKSIQYFPITGTKSCINCCYYKQNTKYFCTHKGKKFNKPFENCVFWNETYRTLVERTCTSQQMIRSGLPS